MNLVYKKMSAMIVLVWCVAHAQLLMSWKAGSNLRYGSEQKSAIGRMYGARTLLFSSTNV